MNQKRIGGGLLLLAGGAIARDFLSWSVGEVADGLSGYIGARVTLLTFPWVDAVGILGMLVGVWLLLRPKEPIEGKLASAYLRLEAVVQRSRELLANPQEAMPADFLGEAAAACFSLEKLGVRTPAFSGLSRKECLELTRDYFGAMMPMIRDGHLVEARRESYIIAEALECEMDDLSVGWRGAVRRWKLNRAKRQVKTA
jgi:hypothetical protein